MPAPSSIADQEMSAIADVLGILWLRRRLIAAVMILLTLLAVGVALLATPVYRAEVVLIPNANTDPGSDLSGSLGSLGGLASLAGVDLGGSGALTQEALAVLRSRQFTESFIEAEGIAAELFTSLPDRVIRNRWRSPEARRPTLAEAARRFDRRLRTMVQDRKTGLLRMQVDWKDPEKAARWANGQVDRLNEEMRVRAKAQAERNLGFLEQEMGRTGIVSTRDALGRLILTNTKDRMMAAVTPDFAFRVVDRAMVPDVRDPIFPRKGWLIGGAPLLGLVLGILFALLLEAYSVRRRGI
jgi:uncharacterized protein involved in exopolysaccharide biosynthesis